MWQLDAFSIVTTGKSPTKFINGDASTEGLAWVVYYIFLGINRIVLEHYGNRFFICRSHTFDVAFNFRAPLGWCYCLELDRQYRARPAILAGEISIVKVRHQ